MKKTFIFSALLFFIMGAGAMAQENTAQENNNYEAAAEEQVATVSHTVAMGETVMLICKKIPGVA
jgi:hypothetical protein